MTMLNFLYRLSVEIDGEAFSAGAEYYRELRGDDAADAGLLAATSEAYQRAEWAYNMAHHGIINAVDYAIALVPAGDRWSPRYARSQACCQTQAVASADWHDEDCAAGNYDPEVLDLQHFSPAFDPF